MPSRIILRWSDQICSELLDAHKDGDLDWCLPVSGQFIQDYLTQYTNETYKLTKDNPMQHACLVQRMMFRRAPLFGNADDKDLQDLPRGV